jgi:hypothetical protein
MPTRQEQQPSPPLNSPEAEAFNTLKTGGWLLYELTKGKQAHRHWLTTEYCDTWQSVLNDARWLDFKWETQALPEMKAAEQLISLVRTQRRLPFGGRFDEDRAN